MVKSIVELVDGGEASNVLIDGRAHAAELGLRGERETPVKGWSVRLSAVLEPVPGGVCSHRQREEAVRSPW